MQVVVRPVCRPWWCRILHFGRERPWSVLQGLLGACLLFVLVPRVGGASPAALGMQRAARPAITSPLGRGFLLTVYGRGFGTAPLLGRLGDDRSMDDVEQQVAGARRAIAGQTGRPVRVAIHLIYALATPCANSPNCLIYLDDQGVDLVRQYIEPAARRGWLVILDDQLGSSTPVAEMARLIARGYLRFNNVEVAFDPEFRSLPGQETPGVPTGTVATAEINRAMRVLDLSSRLHHLSQRKLVLVHQWTPEMITGNEPLQTNLPDVQPVIVMDGIGTPAEKAHMYGQLLGGATGVLPGIKLFPDNLYDANAPVDEPVLSWPQVLGQPAGGSAQPFLHPVPRVIVLT